MCPPGFGGSPVVRGRPAPQTGSQFRRGIKGVQKDPRRRRPRHSAGIDARLTGRVQVGPEKLILLSTLALVILGPQKLPEATRVAGKAIARLRQLSNALQAECAGRW